MKQSEASESFEIFHEMIEILQEKVNKAVLVGAREIDLRDATEYIQTSLARDQASFSKTPISPPVSTITDSSPEITSNISDGHSRSINSTHSNPLAPILPVHYVHNSSLSSNKSTITPRTATDMYNAVRNFACKQEEELRLKQRIAEEMKDQEELLSNPELTDSNQIKPAAEWRGSQTVFDYFEDEKEMTEVKDPAVSSQIPLLIEPVSISSSATPSVTSTLIEVPVVISAYTSPSVNISKRNTEEAVASNQLLLQSPHVDDMAINPPTTTAKPNAEIHPLPLDFDLKRTSVWELKISDLESRELDKSHIEDPTSSDIDASSKPNKPVPPPPAQTSSCCIIS
jgi:hypothetical protein